MKSLTLILLSTIFLSACFNGGNSATTANKNPFLNGELNPKYEGQLTALAGKILEFKPTKLKLGGCGKHAVHAIRDRDELFIFFSFMSNKRILP